MRLVRRLVLLASFSAIIFVAKLALIWLPNIELVTFLLIMFTIVLKLRDALLISTVYTIVEALLWTLSEQAYIWTVIVLVTYMFKKVFKEDFMLWSILSGFLGLTFGLMCALPIFLLTNREITIFYLIYNIPFDVIHMFFNYLIMLFLGKIVYNKLRELLDRYYQSGGINENIY